MKNLVFVCVLAVGLVVVTAALTNFRYTYVGGRIASDKWTGKILYNDPPEIPPMVDTGLWVVGAVGAGGALYLLSGIAKKKVG